MDEMEHGADGEMAMGSPDDLDLSTDKMSEAGMFHVKVEPLSEPVQINEIHTWKLTVMDMDMQPVDNATITFGGGMPEHGHGFPTEPEVVAGDEAGTYLIEGIKMQMAGWWEMKLDIATDTTMDSATFNIVLP